MKNSWEGGLGDTRGSATRDRRDSTSCGGQPPASPPEGESSFKASRRGSRHCKLGGFCLFALGGLGQQWREKRDDFLMYQENENNVKPEPLRCELLYFFEPKQVFLNLNLDFILVFGSQVTYM